MWHGFCWVATLPKFNTLHPTLARFLLCVCAREIVSRGTQHQELRKVKTKIICALMLV